MFLEICHCKEKNIFKLYEGDLFAEVNLCIEIKHCTLPQLAINANFFILCSMYLGYDQYRIVAKRNEIK